MAEHGLRLRFHIALRQRAIHSCGADDIALQKPDIALNVRELCGVKGLIPQTAHDFRGRSLIDGFFDLYLQWLHLSISLDFFFFLLAS